MTKSNFRKRRRDLERVKFELLPRDVFPDEAVFEEYQGRRVSNLLLDFASPLIANLDKDNFFQFKTMIYFAAVAWNFSYFKQGEERKAALDRFLLHSGMFEGKNREKMYNIVDSLSARKMQSYWQYDIMFVTFEIINGEKGNTVMADAIHSSLMNIPVQ
ncbi:MAG TPA: hypothetical protein PK358_02930 [Spirochaetota bacterium]|nr:hypothetical protein [Spirochaetota bacterium]HPJ33762.1 hypothetical protein [Spirochaetota bacterium]